MAKADRTLPWLAPRARDAHKGDLGRVLVVAGSPRMPGAAYLCAQGAMRAGAGLVTIAVPDRLLAVMGAKVLVQTLAELPSTALGTVASGAAAEIEKLSREFDAVALGPGLTTHPETVSCVRSVFASIDRPLVVDADGLNALVGALAARKAPTILTPHPGEMARLLGRTVEEVQRAREKCARTLALETGASVILKGAGSVVTDGKRLRINRTGNPGMATGGSGDVLTGVAAALLARGLSAFDAASLAAHVHGRAGDLAAAARGEEGLLASDLPEFLPRALGERVRRRR